MTAIAPDYVAPSVLDRARVGDHEAFATVVRVYERRLRKSLRQLADVFLEASLIREGEARAAACGSLSNCP